MIRNQPSRALALGLAALLLLPGCRGTDAKADPAPADSSATDAGTAGASLALPVVGETVRRGDLVLSVATTGQVRSDAIAELRAETGGTVTEVLIRPGSRVTRGAPLVRLDPRPFDLAVREAEATLQEAEIRFKGNLVSDSIVLGPQGSAERYQNALALSGVPGARVRLDKAKLDQERATIAAPFDGEVDQVSISAGERVSAGQDIARVVDVSHLRVEAQVLEHDLPSIRVGGDAWVSAAASSGGPVKGRITAILPLVDTTARAGRVVVALPPSRQTAELRPGVYADIRLEANRLPGRILVPTRAVIERDGRPLVFVVKQGRAQWVYINPGRSNGVETEVLPDSSTGQIPVIAGDTVLVEGHLTLTHDAPVKLVARDERSP